MAAKILYRRHFLFFFRTRNNPIRVRLNHYAFRSCCSTRSCSIYPFLSQKVLSTNDGWTFIALSRSSFSRPLPHITIHRKGPFVSFPRYIILALPPLQTCAHEFRSDILMDIADKNGYPKLNGGRIRNIRLRLGYFWTKKPGLFFLASLDIPLMNQDHSLINIHPFSPPPILAQS